MIEIDGSPEQLAMLSQKASDMGVTEEEIKTVTSGSSGERRSVIGDKPFNLMAIEDAKEGLTQQEMDFIPTEEYSLEDLYPVGKGNTVVQVRNEKSVKAMAATSALLSGSMEAATDIFDSIIQESLNGEDLVTQKDALQSTRSTAVAANQGIAATILTDESLDDKTKLAAMDEINNPNSDLYDPVNLLSQKALTQPAKFEFGEAEEQRVSMAAALQTVNKQRAENNKLYNHYNARLDSDTSSAAMDFAVLLTPFLESTMVQSVFDELKKSVDLGDTDGVLNNLAGSQKSAIKKAIQNASPSKQQEIAQAIANIVTTHAGLPITGGNDVFQSDLLETFLTDRDYSATDEVLDSMIEVLDYTILGGAAMRLGKSATKAFTATGRTVESVIRDATRANVRAQEMPRSPAKVVQDNNPDGARDLHKQVALDDTDASAEALYGVSKQDAIVDDVQAQIMSDDGVVKYKVGDLDLEVEGDVIEIALKTGETERSAKEKLALHNKYTSLYENVKGMSLRREMVQAGSITKEADGIAVNAVYGPAEGGFSNAQDAVDMALWSMRDLGVTSDNITVLQRVGDGYVPIKLSDANAWDLGVKTLTDQGTVLRPKQGQVLPSQDYLVQVNSEFKFKDSDVGVWSEITTKYNLFDRIGAGAGVIGEKAAGFISGIQAYALDPHSMIDPLITKAASKSVARSAAIEKELLETGGAFAKGFTKLKRNRQAVLEDIIKEANAKGINYNNTRAAADGLSADEIQVLSDWKKTWDTIYVLENADAVRSLRNGGYKEFVDASSDTKLFAKPINRASVENPTVYDPQTGKSKLITNKEMDKLYEEGGTISRLRNPVTVGDMDYDLIAVTNKKGDAYLREMNDHSAAIQYREGYYAVKYKDRYFIDQVFKKADGSTYTRAIATAPSAKEAALLQRRLKASDPEAEFHDPRLDMKGSSQSDSDSWDMMHNSGRSSQRARGERLTGVSDMGGIDPSQANIMGPVESMLSSARSTANRVSMRKVIETSKSRFAKQYAEYMPVDPLTKGTQWPTDISGIKHRGGSKFEPKDLADARTTWNYLNYLENGYTNAVDDLYKGLLNGLATRAGSISQNTEKALAYMASTRGPTGFGKNIAFNAYLALNPLRQAVIQSHQAVQLTANFGKEVLKDIPTLVPILTTMQMGAKVSDLPKSMKALSGMTDAELDTMFKQFKESGLVASIDKQNLVRSGMTHLADQTIKSPVAGKAGALAKDGLGFVRKMGFDAGENFNMMSAWLAHRGRAVRRGEDMGNKEIADNVTSEAINYTYNMNAAGDMKYNSDSLALLFQFLQVPHKAFTQMAFNRVLTGAERGRLAAYNLVAYGLPSAVFYEMAPEMFPDSPDLQHAAVFGMESLFLNKMLNDNVGTETDYTGLAPTGMYGLAETITGMLTTDVSELVANTPAGKLFIGSSPRITNAFKVIGRAFGLSEDFEKTPTTMLMAGQEFIKIASGFSNVFQGLYMNEFSRTMNGLDMNVTEEDAFRKAAFGFPTADESRARNQMNKYFKDTKQIKEDVKSFYTQYKAQLLRAGIQTDEMDWGVRTLNEAFRVWEKDPRTLELVNKELEGLIRRDVNRKDTALVDMLMRTAGFMSSDEVMAWANSLPESEAYNKVDIIEMFRRMMEE
jgi:hypothetical protein